MSEGLDDFSHKPHRDLKPLYDTLVKEKFDVRIQLYNSDHVAESLSAKMYGSRALNVFSNDIDVAIIHAWRDMDTDELMEWTFASSTCNMKVDCSDMGLVVAVLRYLIK
jgi:hypothetical protein